MKVTGTFQIKATHVYPCPPLPVLHTPARKVKSEPKHREWRVNPMARITTQYQHHNRTTNSSASSPGTSHSHSSDKLDSETPSSASNHQNATRIILENKKFDGVRKIQYISMNMKFANLTMALNSGYQKTQEQAEKRLKMEQTVKENLGQVMSC